MKKCTQCGTDKIAIDFSKKQTSCKLCVNTKAMKKRRSNPDGTRAKNLKARFNITIECYNVMFLKQKGKCAICSKAETALDNKGNIRWLACDHNHKTGDIRGLLCSCCNTGLGLLGDSTKILSNAIKYLEKRGSYGE